MRDRVPGPHSLQRGLGVCRGQSPPSPPRAQLQSRGDSSEGLIMDETAKMESHLSSAAAFVEGGIQDACDDACSICLEAFCESDPSTVTGCKHEFHLQCILEWCQRSSQCPMCWQSISLKDPTSQELLGAVERERNIRLNHARTTTIFHHPALGDFELQHLPVGGSDADLEERIIQHLAAAAAMGRAHHIARREGRVRSGEEPAEETNVSPAHASQVPFLTSGSSSNPQRSSISSPRTPAQSSPVSQEPGPSDFQSFSETLKSRLNAVSMRYKESIAKSTRGWRERLFSRNSTVADIGSEVRREVNAGIATVSRMMERLDTRETRRMSGVSAPPSDEVHSVMEPTNEGVTANHANSHPNNSTTSKIKGRQKVHEGEMLKRKLQIVLQFTNY
ncbi:hypothetical protein OPV22_028050 [Ensete ventricosum]|uniref:RING-type E3 ubiquitin transferase n=1 Tax=Ensete ventricosum TaxID=4639 RepID=A0AAV8Q765_ENSVE|nr:hypothetical protein OPV22_028050 [Ensete ventricosum]